MKWWREIKGDGEAVRLGTAAIGDLWKSLAAHPAILYWERLVFQPCSTLGASRAVNSCTRQHWPISVSDQITLGRILGFLLCCLVVLADRGCFLSSSWWSNSLAIHVCSLEKVEQSLEGGDLREQSQNRCWSPASRKTIVPSVCYFFQPLGSQWISVAQLIPDEQPRERGNYRNAWRALNKSWKAGYVPAEFKCRCWFSLQHSPACLFGTAAIAWSWWVQM